jgi:hypothetical protein
MSHISGVKRALTHTNSFAGERLPKYGVETLKEEELGHVSDHSIIYFDLIVMATPGLIKGDRDRER